MLEGGFSDHHHWLQGVARLNAYDPAPLTNFICRQPSRRCRGAEPWLLPVCRW